MHTSRKKCKAPHLECSTTTVATVAHHLGICPLTGAPPKKIIIKQKHQVKNGGVPVGSLVRNVTSKLCIYIYNIHVYLYVPGDWALASHSTR